MILKDEAMKSVTEFLNNDFVDCEGEVVIVEDATIEREYGWIFFYNTLEYLQTKDIIYALAGNGPVVFNKSTRKIDTLGTNKEISEIIRDYEVNQGLIDC